MRGELIAAVFRNAKHLPGIFAMHAPVVFRRAIGVYTNGNFIFGTAQYSRHFSCSRIALQGLGCVGRAARQESDPDKKWYHDATEHEWLHTLMVAQGKAGRKPSGQVLRSEPAILCGDPCRHACIVQYQGNVGLETSATGRGRDARQQERR
jgi:hypothetical protein